MAASYPGGIRSTFTQKVNFSDVVNDYNVNDLQDEVVAIETAVGVNPGTSNFSGSFSSSSYAYPTVSARIANVEAGIVGDSHTQYLKVAGGSTVTPSTTTTVGVKLKAISSQTSDQLQVLDTSNNVLAKIDAAGNVYGYNSATSAPALLGFNQDVSNLYVLMMFDQL